MPRVYGPFSNEANATPASAGPSDWYYAKGANVYRLVTGSWSLIHTAGGGRTVYGIDYDDENDKLVILEETTGDGALVTMDFDGSNVASVTVNADQVALGADGSRSRAAYGRGGTLYAMTYAGTESTLHSGGNSAQGVGYDPVADRYIFLRDSFGNNLRAVNGDGTGQVQVGGFRSTLNGQSRPDFGAGYTFFASHTTSGIIERCAISNGGTATFTTIVSGGGVIRKGVAIFRPAGLIYSLVGSGTTFNLISYDYDGAVVGTVSGPFTISIAAGDDISLACRVV